MRHPTYFERVFWSDLYISNKLWSNSGVGKLFTRRATWKNFEAEGRTDWKSKKKVNTSSDVLFSTKNQ